MRIRQFTTFWMCAAAMACLTPQLASPQIPARGTGLHFHPRGLQFGPIAVGSTSARTVATLINNTASGIKLQYEMLGKDFGDFSQRNTCGGYLKPNGRCSVLIKFTPHEKGLRTATLEVTTRNFLSAKLKLSGVGT